MNLLDKTEELFSKMKYDAVLAAEALYQCKQQGVWSERYSTFGEFVETLGVSQSGASKMISWFTHFAIEGGVSHAKLAEIDTEKLYLATTLEGTPEEQVEKAMVLSRGEIKAQRIADKTGHECTHEETVTICKSCHTRLG